VYPCVETVQQDHVCRIVYAPAPIEEALRRRAQELAVAAVEAIEGIGIFGVELFLSQDGQLYINELAPRPHNTGHYTIEACYTSQFENALRAVCNLPLGSPEMYVPAAVMINLLGVRSGSGFPDDVEPALQAGPAWIHFYGKRESRPRRKLGHVTARWCYSGGSLRARPCRCREHPLVNSHSVRAAPREQPLQARLRYCTAELPDPLLERYQRPGRSAELLDAHPTSSSVAARMRSQLSTHSHRNPFRPRRLRGPVHQLQHRGCSGSNISASSSCSRSTASVYWVKSLVPMLRKSDTSASFAAPSAAAGVSTMLPSAGSRPR
jgi:hypothetical protein